MNFLITNRCRIGSLICSSSQITYLHFSRKMTFIRTEGFHGLKSGTVQIEKIILQRKRSQPFSCHSQEQLSLSAVRTQTLSCIHRQTWDSRLASVCSHTHTHTHTHPLVIGHIFVSLNSLSQQFLNSP
ncbi:hypothetical protein HJG60_007991 [Phyllostomus discolor]|uniref:Uncharacterized protein n=1 Tax=Phyllostomus discolor TaxID=89673 RepID=A0A834BN30_9CHIR|nr:hypothetical protein HJG60_007991 [Phyllostomus discolor]